MQQHKTNKSINFQRIKFSNCFHIHMQSTQLVVRLALVSQRIASPVRQNYGAQIIWHVPYDGNSKTAFGITSRICKRTQSKKKKNVCFSQTVVNRHAIVCVCASAEYANSINDKLVVITIYVIHSSDGPTWHGCVCVSENTEQVSGLFSNSYSSTRNADTPLPSP